MRNFIAYLLQDWQANSNTSLKSRFVLVMFRFAQKSSAWPFPAYYLRFVYQIIVEWIFGIDLPWDTQVGCNLQLQHGVALVVNHEVIIGSGCILRHSTTIGNKKYLDGQCSCSPIIGNNVEIGANVVILGPIKVGNYAIIGAGSVVVKDVPDGAVVVGNPAKIIKLRDREMQPPYASHSDSLEAIS